MTFFLRLPRFANLFVTLPLKVVLSAHLQTAANLHQNSSSFGFWPHKNTCDVIAPSTSQFRNKKQKRNLDFFPTCKEKIYVQISGKLCNIAGQFYIVTCHFKLQRAYDFFTKPKTMFCKCVLATFNNSPFNLNTQGTCRSTFVGAQVGHRHD